MADNRHKNIDWQLPAGGARVSYDQAKIAVLMDIRDELQALRRIFECVNFQMLPKVAERIARNTAKPKKPAVDAKN